MFSFSPFIYCITCLSVPGNSQLFISERRWYQITNVVINYLQRPSVVSNIVVILVNNVVFMISKSVDQSYKTDFPSTNVTVVSIVSLTRTETLSKRNGKHIYFNQQNQIYIYQIRS